MVVPAELSLLGRCLLRSRSPAAGLVCRRVNMVGSRHYATRIWLPRPSKAPKVRRMQPEMGKGSVDENMRPIETPTLSASNVGFLPRRALFENVVRQHSGTFDLMSADEYYFQLKKAAEFFSTRSKSQAGLNTNFLEHTVLHDLGCIVLQVSSKAHAKLALDLWELAAHRRYTPSILSLVWFLVRVNHCDTIARYRHIKTIFDELSGLIPCSIRAELYYRQRKYQKAEELLRDTLAAHAADVAAADKDAADNCEPNSRSSLGKVLDAAEIAAADLWEPNARLTLGKVLVATGRYDEAYDILVRLVEQNASVDAHYHLAKLLLMRQQPRARADEDAAMQHLFVAAGSGMLQAFEEMAAVELERASRAEGTAAVVEHQRWADEYLRLADKSAV